MRDVGAFAVAVLDTSMTIDTEDFVNTASAYGVPKVVLVSKRALDPQNERVRPFVADEKCPILYGRGETLRYVLEALGGQSQR